MNQVKKLFNKNYILLFQGQTVSRIGSQLYFMAMALFVKELTGSGSVMGLLVMLTSIPAIFLAPIGGTYADRFSRKKIIVITDFLNGVLMLIFVFFVIYFPTNKPILLTCLLIISLTSNVLASFFTPAISASLPDIVPKNKLNVANSLGQASVQTSTILGWGLSGVLYIILGVPLLIFMNGLTFIFSGFSEIFIKIPQRIPKQVKSWRQQVKVFKKDTIEGMRYVWKRSGLKKMVFASVFMAFFTSPVIFLLLFYTDLILHKPASWVGYLIAINSIGAMVGSLFAGAFKISPQMRSNVMVLFILLNSSVYLILGFISSAILALGLLFTSGIFSGFIQVYIMTIMQLTTSSKIRGRVFGFLGTISGISGPLGVGIGGIIYDISNNIPMIYATCGIFMVFIAIIVFLSKDIRLFLAYDHKKEKEVQFDNV